MSDRDRLIELIGDKITTSEYENYNSFEYAEHLATHLLANGVIVPPCKVGDKVYQYDTAGDIYESEITKIIYDTKGVAFDERAIGKTVFLTKEEAEQALKEREG